MYKESTKCGVPVYPQQHVAILLFVCDVKGHVDIYLSYDRGSKCLSGVLASELRISMVTGRAES